MNVILQKPIGHETTTINSDCLAEIFKYFVNGNKVIFSYPDHKETVINIDSNGSNITIHTDTKMYNFKNFWYENVAFEVHVL